MESSCKWAHTGANSDFPNLTPWLCTARTHCKDCFWDFTGTYLLWMCSVLLRCSLLWQGHLLWCSPFKILCPLHLVASNILNKYIFAVVLLQDLILSHPIMGSQKWLLLRKSCVSKTWICHRGGLAPCFHFWLYSCFRGGQKKAQPQPNTEHFLFFPAQPFSYSHTLCLSNPLMWDTKARQGHLFSPGWS